MTLETQAPTRGVNGSSLCNVALFQLSYMAFLMLFSVVLLIDFHEKMSVSEYILIVWVVTLFAEEVRQVRI